MARVQCDHPDFQHRLDRQLPHTERNAVFNRQHHRNRFSVRGDYDVGVQQPRWGWRTEYALVDDNHLRVTAYNITADGLEYLAVETLYARAASR